MVLYLIIRPICLPEYIRDVRSVILGGILIRIRLGRDVHSV
jgi:hypothetical protein